MPVPAFTILLIFAGRFGRPQIPAVLFCWRTAAGCGAHPHLSSCCCAQRSASGLEGAAEPLRGTGS
jgi:hypothetical protein